MDLCEHETMCWMCEYEAFIYYSQLIWGKKHKKKNINKMEDTIGNILV